MENEHDKSADEGNFIPSITVPDSDDRQTVMAALLMYSTQMTVGPFMGRSSLDNTISEMAIVARLMRALRDQDATDAANEVFRDSGSFAAFFRRIHDEHGDD